MSTESLHIVHKLIVEVETNSKAKGYALRDEAAGFVSGSLSPALETLFAELEKKLNGKVLTLDHLSVEITASTTDLTHGDIERLICQAVQKEIDNGFLSTELHESAAHQPEQDQLIPVTKRQLQSIFHFLKTGSRPWWIPDNATLSQLTETSNLLELAKTDTETLIRELASTPSQNFLKRMVFQVPEFVLIEWFARAFHFPKEPGVLPQTIPFIQSREIREKWWNLLSEIFRQYQSKAIPAEKMEQLVLLPVHNNTPEPETITSFVTAITGQAIPSAVKEKLQAVLKQTNRTKPAETEKTAETPEKYGEPLEVKEYTPVENAGLILLHPFLRPFFTEIGLMEGNQLTDPELAAHVLHFLATGNENAWEYELQFEKFLCGIPSEEPIQQERFISDEIKKESENLLAAVLEHWAALKSDSPDLLRFEFLQREAKIIEEEFQTTRLVFARKAQDILLDNLPWNLGIVKVDWRKDLLFIEW